MDGIAVPLRIRNFGDVIIFTDKYFSRKRFFVGGQGRGGAAAPRTLLEISAGRPLLEKKSGFFHVSDALKI